MTRILLVVSLIVALWSIAPLASSNGYMDVGKYDTIQVQSGDSVWNIAKKYVTTKDDIRELTQAINQLNGLQKNSQIFPGQVLKIPIRS